MRNQKGITLVALVITIVVLLILAGVTISMVMGPNGVLTNANKAKEGSAEGNARDALTMALSSISSNYYAGDFSNGNSTATSLQAACTAQTLHDAAPEYTFTMGNWTGTGDAATATVSMVKDGDASASFTATISSQLTITSFGRTSN